MMRYRAVILLVCLLATGCATREAPRSGTEDAPDPTEEAVPEQEEADASPDEPDEDKPAVAELTREAEGASAAGEHARAVRLLERALRLSPRHAGLWQNLAVVRYRQGRYEKAETLAQRSNRLSSGNHELRRRNWSLIAATRRKRGDTAGARQAQQRAQGAVQEAGSP